MSGRRPDQEDAALRALAAPLRRELFRYVCGQDTPVDHDRAAEAVGVSRSLAAYHLGRLAEAGLLRVHFERRGGQEGPGAGRPAKFFTPATREVQLSVPPRDYELAARVLLGAVGGDSSGHLRERLEGRAERMGAEMAAAPTTGEEQEPLARLLAVLRNRGYQPHREEATGRVRLANCPFDGLRGDHGETVCAMNLALARGLARVATGGRARAVVVPEEGGCCVAFEAGG